MSLISHSLHSSNIYFPHFSYRELLGHLNKEQLATLEKALCSAEGLGTLKRNAAAKRSQSKKTQQASPETASVESSSNETLEHSYTLDSRDTTNTVFEPAPVHSEQDKEESAAPTVLVTEETPFPRLGDHEPIPNDLPSSSNSMPTLEAAAVSQLAPQGATSPPKTKSGKKRRYSGPAGFPNAEDLMHRLFLGISGVADQLQTNHARDLRVILKHVFTVCQEPEEEVEVISRLEECVQEACSPEPVSPLITGSQSKSGGCTDLISLWLVQSCSFHFDCLYCNR